MGRKILVVLFALLPGVASLAAPDTMLCLHRDGQVRVEPIEPSCCRGEESEPACPDDQCQDLPVVEASPLGAPDAPMTLDVTSIPADLSLESVGLPPAPEFRRPRSFSGPPPPGSDPHVSIFILRL